MKNAKPPHTTQNVAKKSILLWAGAPTQHCHKTSSADAPVKQVKLNLYPNAISPATADYATLTDAPLCFMQRHPLMEDKVIQYQIKL
jgi:hypothetical protein